MNPETSVEQIVEYIDHLDEVLVMTVNPGFYGSKFVPEALKKVSKLRAIAPDMDIEVDGSINDQTIGEAAEAGANLFVSGSYILKSKNPKKAIEILKSKI